MTEEMLSAGNVAVKGFLANSELSAIYLAMRALDPQVAALEAALEALTYIRQRIAGGLHIGQPQLKMIDAVLATIQKGLGE